MIHGGSRRGIPPASLTILRAGLGAVLATLALARDVDRGLRANYDNPYGLMSIMATNIKLHAFAGLLLIAGSVVAIVAGHVWHPPPFFLR